jgi:glycogen phosphorylase
MRHLWTSLFSLPLMTPPSKSDRKPMELLMSTVKYAPLAPVPLRIGRLNELAYDLWWSWNEEAGETFRALDESLWSLTAENPVVLLHLITAVRLKQAAADSVFLALYDAAIVRFDALSSAQTWWGQRFSKSSVKTIAYFSAEFALHPSVPIYAGGLGVLAGDHCKEASDLGVPLVGVGLMYPRGYFHQNVSAAGWQEEVYEYLDWSDGPIEPALTASGAPCRITITIGEREVRLAVWQVHLGRVTLYLLDADLEENTPQDRELSARLYGGDHTVRIQQEIILGVGGVHAIRALGIHPDIWHLNEGHAAFVSLERIKDGMANGETFDEALERVRRSTVFTTHTPVPAGHDAFPFHVIDAHLAGCWSGTGDHRDAFLQLGHYDNGGGAMFNMTALAMRTSSAINAVSQLHRTVTAGMWAPLWPTLLEAERPIRGITNGVHIPTWIAPELSRLFCRYLGNNWQDHQDEPAFWDGVLLIPDEELWQIRRTLKGGLCTFIRSRARQRWSQERVSADRVLAGGTLLDPETLTIGFARRFTGYKRPELIFHDAARLARILKHQRRPVQIIFAGKSHPADNIGKNHLQRIYQHAIDPAFAGQIAFVDDYDLRVAHFLVQGCDVWLNTPRKPLEASGTSGMKASVNGVLNLSVGDGWWAEGYNGSNGWLIESDCAGDERAVDAAEAEVLYRLLEEDIVPAFYDRGPTGLPKQWVRLVKEAIRTVMSGFCARRMVKEYAEHVYTTRAIPEKAVRGPLAM